MSDRFLEHEIRKIAQRLSGIDRRLTATERAPKGRHSSQTGSYGIYDENGNLRTVVGAQPDGTYTNVDQNGAVLNTPSKPLVSKVASGVTISWDGKDDKGDDIWPYDFSFVSVRMTTVPGEETDVADQIAVFSARKAPNGDTVTFAQPTDITTYITFVAVNTSGIESDESEEVTVVGGGVTEGLEELESKSTIYRQTTPPWPNGSADHADDIGDLWFDITLGDGPEVRIWQMSLLSNVATISVDPNHMIDVGDNVDVFGLGVPFDGTHVATAVGTVTVGAGETAVTYGTVSYLAVGTDVPLTEINDEEATAQGDATGVPLNHAYIWDGAIWNDAQDREVDLAKSLIDTAQIQVNTNAAEIDRAKNDIDTLKNTATDIQGLAYAADGRINISDYDPTAEDMLNGDGTPKNDGSLWITRTRNRRNYCINPSFEVGTSPYTYTNCTGARTLVTVGFPADGDYALQVVNDGALGPYEVSYGLVTGLPALEPGEDLGGQQWTMSGHVAREVGSLGTGITASIEFLDASDAVLLRVTGEPEVAGLTTAQWSRPYVGGTAPAGTMKIRGPIFDNPNADDVWWVDGVLIELNQRLGRYFDGGSKGGSWVNPSTPDASISELDGGAIIRFFSLEDGNWVEKFWTSDTISSVNAGAIRGGDGYVRPDSLYVPESNPPVPTSQLDGALIADNTIPIDKNVVASVTCSEAVTAGALVNIWSNEGIPMVRLAKAALGYDADAFVLEAAAIGDPVRIYQYGYNPLMVDLSPGMQFLSTEPGKASASPPIEIGTIVQRVGYASEETVLNFAPMTSVAIV